MLLRPLTGMTMIGATLLGGAFATGVAVGLGSVAAACGARRAMKRRSGWSEDRDDPPKAEPPPPVSDPLPVS
jgi:hypothetical protein